MSYNPPNSTLPNNTYSASVNSFACAALATDIFTITGSATKIIKITKFDVTATTTSGSGISVPFTVIKRSATNTGGTSTILNNVSYDSTNSASTAVVRNYTANPTGLGTPVGIILARRITVNSSGAVVQPISLDYNTRENAQPITLRGTSEILSINLSGTTITGPLISITIEWEEI